MTVLSHVYSVHSDRVSDSQIQLKLVGSHAATTLAVDCESSSRPAMNAASATAGMAGLGDHRATLRAGSFSDSSVSKISTCDRTLSLSLSSSAARAFAKWISAALPLRD